MSRRCIRPREPVVDEFGGEPEVVSDAPCNGAHPRHEHLAIEYAEVIKRRVSDRHGRVVGDTFGLEVRHRDVASRLGGMPRKAQIASFWLPDLAEQGRGGGKGNSGRPLALDSVLAGGRNPLAQDRRLADLQRRCC